MKLKEIKSKANSLKPLISIGKNKLNENQIKMISDKLKKDKVIKIKIQKNIKEEKKIIAEKLSKTTETEIAEIKGNTVVLFKKS